MELDYVDSNITFCVLECVILQQSVS